MSREGYKQIEVSKKNHKTLSIIKANYGHVTYDDTIEFLIEEHRLYAGDDQ